MPSYRFDTPGAVTATVKVKSGTIDVSSHDGDVTEVEVKTPGQSDLAERVVVEHTETGDGHEVVVTVPDGDGFRLGSLLIGRSEAVDISLRVPHGASLGLSTASGAIRAQGRYATVTVDTASGDVDLDDVDGDLDTRSASGDVTVGRVGGEGRMRSASGDLRCGQAEGPLQVMTASGDVRIGRCSQRLQASSASGDVTVTELAQGGGVKTASGDIRVERVVTGETRLEAVTGDVSVGIARGSTISVDATSINGDLSSEIEFSDDLDDDVEGAVAQAGHVDLVARTASGDVRVKRAAG